MSLDGRSEWDGHAQMDVFMVVVAVVHRSHLD